MDLHQFYLVMRRESPGSSFHAGNVRKEAGSLTFWFQACPLFSWLAAINCPEHRYNVAPKAPENDRGECCMQRHTLTPKPKVPPDQTQRDVQKQERRFMEYEVVCWINTTCPSVTIFKHRMNDKKVAWSEGSSGQYSSRRLLCSSHRKLFWLPLHAPAACSWVSGDQILNAIARCSSLANPIAAYHLKESSFCSRKQGKCANSNRMR